MRTRIDFVDVTRAFAIALVTFNHAMGDFSVWNTVSVRAADAATFVARTGTPIFVLLFGMMVELAHVRRAERFGVDALVPRLRRRAFECYAGYLFVSACASWRPTGFDVDRFAKSTLFLGGGGFGTVLGTYTILLLLTPKLLRFRLRFGHLAAPAVIAAVWALDLFVLASYDGRDAGFWAYLIDHMLGAGRHIRGPSVLHALTFVCAGMFVAAGLRTWRAHGSRDFTRRLSIGAATAAAVVAVLAIRYGLDGVLEGFRVYRQFRRDNAPGYFAVGVLASFAVLAVACATVPRRGLPRWSEVPMQLGRSSLLAFTFGGAGLHLLPVDMPSGPVTRPLAAVLYVLAVMAAVNWRRITRSPAYPDPAAPPRPQPASA